MILMVVGGGTGSDIDGVSNIDTNGARLEHC